MEASAALLELLPSRARFATVVVDDENVEGLGPLFPGEGPETPGSWAPKRLREFRAGRHLARRVLGELGHAASALPRDSDGVPCFPSGVAASITHTGGRVTFAAAAALVDARGLGLDAEVTRSLSPEVLERILGASERLELARWGPLEELGLLAFSAKEAFYKCVYPRTRRFLEFEQAELRVLELESQGSERRGRFVVNSATARAQGGPSELEVVFRSDDERVISCALWE